MDELRKQVLRAHRRLSLQRFLSVLSWSLFATLMLAAIAIAIPKVWALPVDVGRWTVGWFIGAVVAGALIAIVYAFVARRSPLEAAIEIDRRFGLKERVSSTFALSESELATTAGQALVADASRRVARLDVAEQFTIQGRWTSLLPLASALLALLLIFIPNAILKPTVSNAASLDVKKQVQNSTDELRKKWAEQRRKAEEKDLEAAKLFSELEKGVGDINKLGDIDKKKALVKLNDLAEEIKKRRNELGDTSKLQKQLNQLKNLKPGPAKNLVKAMKDGDFSKAVSEIKTLQNQIATGKMSDKDREALADQLQQMADKLRQQVAAQEMAKEELQKQIEQAKNQGDNAKAGELQRKLDAMKAQGPQMAQMKKLAEKLSQASKASAQGNPQQAADQLESLAGDLEALKAELEELDMLDEAMEQLASAKDAMNCPKCNGMGCPSCNGMGTGMGKIPGMGMGEGEGQGDRPEAETDKSYYDSQVRGDIGKGKAVATGYADGKNIAGDALEEIKQAMEASGSEASDPLTNVRLPREHKDHAREYFESFDPSK